MANFPISNRVKLTYYIEREYVYIKGVVVMELYKEILAHALAYGEVRVIFPELDPAQIVESACYQALQKIKAIIADDSLEDVDCFMKIEQIICALEGVGSNGGSRHDFG